MLIRNYLSTSPITATFARNTASYLAGLSLRSATTLILTTTLLLTLCILTGAQSYI